MKRTQAAAPSAGLQSMAEPDGFADDGGFRSMSDCDVRHSQPEFSLHCGEMFSASYLRIWSPVETPDRLQGGAYADFRLSGGPATSQ